jgi:hypothetical protein
VDSFAVICRRCRGGGKEGEERGEGVGHQGKGEDWGSSIERRGERCGRRLGWWGWTG